MNGGGSLRGRVAGAALRRYREAAGWPIDDAARVLGCDRSKISRIENGLRGVRLPELQVLLGEYGAGPREQGILEALADRRAGHGWWDEYADVLPADARDYLALETLASRVLVYEPQQVPDLLQTGPYALDLARADPGVPPGSHDRAAEAVVIRQRAVLDQGRPQITAVLGEAALCQQVGGTAVLHAQLTGLAALSEQRLQVSVQLLPFSCGAHPGSGTGPLAVLELAGSPPLGVVRLGGLAGGVYLAEPEAVARHASLLRRLQAAALPPDKSAQLIRDARARSRP